jgi:hypothetical protein
LAESEKTKRSTPPTIRWARSTGCLTPATTRSSSTPWRRHQGRGGEPRRSSPTPRSASAVRSATAATCTGDLGTPYRGLGGDGNRRRDRVPRRGRHSDTMTQYNGRPRAGAYAVEDGRSSSSAGLRPTRTSRQRRLAGRAGLNDPDRPEVPSSEAKGRLAAAGRPAAHRGD